MIVESQLKLVSRFFYFSITKLWIHL